MLLDLGLIAKLKCKFLYFFSSLFVSVEEKINLFYDLSPIFTRCVIKCGHHSEFSFFFLCQMLFGWQ